MIRKKTETKTLIKTVAVLTVLMLIFAGCSEVSDISDTVIEEKTEETDFMQQQEEEDSVLRVGTLPFNGNFSPFFYESSSDKQIVDLTSVPLLSFDRTGGIITKGIEGQTVSYGGKEYTYFGICDLEITEHTNGQVYYDFTLRDDILFSDGMPLTADDVIFSMYVLCDPSYDGKSDFSTLPIRGLTEYIDSTSPLIDLLIEAGDDNLDFTYWTEEQQTSFWADLEKAGTAFAKQIVDYCTKAGYIEEGDVAGAARTWSFNGLSSKATETDFFYTMCESYRWDLKALSETEAVGASLFELMDNYESYTVPVNIGTLETSIFGIIKTGDYSLRVVLTDADYTSLYKFAINVAPLHYYGDKNLYDYKNSSFGFEKCDLSKIKEKNALPLGAGAYRFVSGNSETVTLAANRNYYKGTPATDKIEFIRMQHNEMVKSMESGNIDLALPEFNMETETDIKHANGGDISGGIINSSIYNSMSYGYIGMNSECVNVGGVPDSEASRNLRKAFGTVFAACRSTSIAESMGSRAKIIEYPISDTSWAAPHAGEESFEQAFSEDINGSSIYTDGMSEDERISKALNAALGFFNAAGYTVEEGMLTFAPEGAKLSYELFVPADGTGDHPSYVLLTKAKDALMTIGMELKITDLVNTSTLWPALNAQEAAMWAAAWNSPVDPDMYKIYFSGGEAGVAGGSNYMYSVSDEKLNELIIAARSSLNNTYRKGIYRQCLDIIKDWAVEIPVYQRQNIMITSAERVDAETLPKDITPFYGWTNEIEKLSLISE